MEKAVTKLPGFRGNLLRHVTYVVVVVGFKLIFRSLHATRVATLLIFLLFAISNKAYYGLRLRIFLYMFRRANYQNAPFCDVIGIETTTLKCQINRGVLIDRGSEKFRNLINVGGQNKRGLEFEKRL